MVQYTVPVVDGLVKTRSAGVSGPYAEIAVADDLIKRYPRLYHL